MSASPASAFAIAAPVPSGMKLIVIQGYCAWKAVFDVACFRCLRVLCHEGLWLWQLSRLWDLGVGLGDGVGIGVGVELAVAVGVGVAVGVVVGELVGEAVGEGVGVGVVVRRS